MIISFGSIRINIQMHTQELPSNKNINIADNLKIDIGGASALQIIAAARCGAKTALCGTIGDDLFGKKIIESLRREGIQHSALTQNNIPTPVSTTVTTDKEDPLILQTPTIEHIPIETLIPDTSLNERVLLLLNQDISIETLTKTIERAKHRNAKTILCLEHQTDIPQTIIDQCNLVIYGYTTGIMNHTHVIFTQGKAIGCDQSGEKYAFNSKQIPKDFSGAFNTFCGFTAACLQAGLNLERAMEHGFHAALITSSKDGTYNAIPYLDEVQKAMKKN